MEGPAPAEADGPLDCASLIEGGWFLEKNSQWPGQANALKVQEILLHKRTDFQDIMVFQSTDWGRVLVLDGVIQLTERDEMSYQEMMAHLPLFSHESPGDVLILGGGDGGVLREVVKHKCVSRVTHCEIDAGVIEASKHFFPTVSCAFSNPKVNVLIGDGVGFAEKSADASFDVIIVDSSDPVGPAEGLFSKDFYANAHRILKPGGVICSQGECLWVHVDLIQKMLQEHGAPFASAEYASIQVPTYPSGQIGALLARKAHADSGAQPTCKSPRRPVPDDMELRYYSAEMHQAAFAAAGLPAAEALFGGVAQAGSQTGHAGSAGARATLARCRVVEAGRCREQD
eukprot:CAMPEP_0175415896 /NCGR_PEP_ID=MMETSP0095-20121207/44410_1 /TAXON_ID=311494 /ORGANISM="Alexandrium monilatum, Strain CCMP3105" /LENGTH=342 /DNA_ID=CAMNT_0016714991 /DNA_START=1 /DNA_END=1028 /DNA_ORIENTATION=+